MILQDEIEETPGSGIWVASGARFTNNTGLAISTVANVLTAEAIAGVYELAFSAVIAATSATVTVSCDGANPYNGRVVTGVPLDNVTVVKNVVPGVGIVFTNNALFTSAWTSEVRVGRFAGSLLNYGPTVGVPQTARRHRVTNVSASLAQLGTLNILNNVQHVKKVGSIFQFVDDFAAGSTPKLTSGQVVPYAITVANQIGSGGSLTCDIKVDGSTVTVVDQTTLVSGPSTGLNVNDKYKIASGGLTDVIFQIDQAALDTSTANILIFDPSSFITIALDVAGVAGTFGTSSISLTESGQSSGNITAGGHAFYWERMTVASMANALSNPYPMKLQITTSPGVMAGWYN